MTDTAPSAQSITVTGVILAGGKSTRMGRDKSSLILNGETLLARTHRVLIDTGCDQVILSGNQREDWPGTNIPDLIPDAGPVSAILSVLCWSHLQCPKNSILLFVPVDTPFMSDRLLKQLVLDSKHSDGCMIENSPLPLAIRLTERVYANIPLFQKRLEDGESCSIRVFLAPLHIVPLALTADMEAAITNINTPDEWQKISSEQ